MKSVSSHTLGQKHQLSQPQKSLRPSKSVDSLEKEPANGTSLDTYTSKGVTSFKVNTNVPVSAPLPKRLDRAAMESLLRERHSATVRSRERTDPQHQKPTTLDDVSIHYSSEKQRPIDLTSFNEMQAGIRVIAETPPSRPNASWEASRLHLHWEGRKKGPGRATGHKNEFQAVPQLGILHARDYERESVQFMNRPLNAHGPVIERISFNGELIRYDTARNLMGSMDPISGQMNTFFRPGFRLRQSIAAYPSTLEPSMRGWLYTKYYVETGKGPVRRK